MPKLQDLSRVFGDISELEGHRNNDLKKIFVDINKRDVGNDTFDINITMYVRPDVPLSGVMPALQRCCIDIWGHDPGDSIELFYHSGQVDAGKFIGLEVMGQKGVFQSFGVTIKHPKSTFYNLDRLKGEFLRRAHYHLYGEK